MNGDSRELAASGRFLRGTARDAIRSKLACGLAFAYNASAACGVSPTTLASHIVNESTLDPTSREFQKGICICSCPDFHQRVTRQRESALGATMETALK